MWVPTLLTAGILCFVGFYAGGGLRLARMTTVEIALTLGSAVIVTCALLLGPARERWEGLWPVGLLVALAVLTALSVVWSVQPDDSFKDTGPSSSAQVTITAEPSVSAISAVVIRARRRPPPA